MGKLMEKGNISGVMGKFMMESGAMALNKGMGFGRGCMETLMSGSGRTPKLMGMVCTPGRMGTGMKESGWIFSNMGMGQTSLRTGIPTLGIITKVNQMELGNTSGNQALYTMDSSGMV